MEKSICCSEQDQRGIDPVNNEGSKQQTDKRTKEVNKYIRGDTDEGMRSRWED